jgi:Zn-dependent peptidase ImmA (M78 family)/DNA-binding XRE family transcriptional regulator
LNRELGERLKYARERAGLTLQQLSERSGLGLSSLSEWEAGKREPRLAQLQALAEALRRSTAFFIEKGRLPEEVVLWRSKPSSPRAEDLEIRFLRLCEQYHYLETWCGEQKKACLPTVANATRGFGYREAEALATKVQQELRLGDRPALVLLSVLEEVCGIKVFHLDFEPAGTAACTLNESFGAGILLNARNVRWRRNFDLAHELFHLLTWGVFSPSKKAHVCADSQEEKFATCFARNLLMPRATLQPRVADILQKKGLKPDDVFDLARQFDVSIEALLRQLAFLYDRTEKQTKDDLARCQALFSVWEGRAPDRPSVRPARFEALAVKALRAGELSLGRFTEYMEISRREARRYVQQEPVNDEEVQITPS